jgi:hypothetical protein
MFLLIFFAMLPLSSTAWTLLLSCRGVGRWCCCLAAVDLRLGVAQDAFLIISQISFRTNSRKRK